ncbi:MAG: PKD domain-containing protein, partial [Bacteroidia bacterium]
VDWEDITYGNDYLFVGDFGNNNGNRQNLKIYRIHKNNLSDTATTAVADVINFSYSDQTSFPSLPNNNNFDCESMIFANDSIHLFSKDWVDKQSRHYVIPNQPGTHLAQMRESFNAGCLITGATIQKGGVIALLGYDNTGAAPVYVWMLYDYKDGYFFNGNKRRFNAGSMLTHGQTEGIDFFNAAYGYISNERFNQIVNIAPKLKTFNLASYLPNAFVYPKPDAGFTESAAVICKNASVTFTDQSTNDPVSWQWSFPGGNPVSSTLQSPQVTYSVTGTYSVTLIAGNATGYDTIVKTNFITVNALPASTITPSGTANFCTGGSVLLTANSGVGLLYQWKKYAVNIAGANAATYTATAAGTYKVTVTNPNGCSKTSAGVIITGPPANTITVTGSLDLCPGDSVKLEVPLAAGNVYQWKKNNVNINGATANFYYASAAGNYKVQITNSFGCSRSSGKKTVTTNCRLYSAEEPYKDKLTVFPNPVSSTYTVSISLHKPQYVVINVFSPDGMLVSSINNQMLAEGSHEFSYDASHLANGIYYCEAIIGEERYKKKLVVVR